LPPPENVDENTLHLGISNQDLEGFFDGFGGRSAVKYESNSLEYEQYIIKITDPPTSREFAGLPP